ncbi:MAG: NfeD family protein [Clostridiales bacterium]|nr:NfeD family protein [Clostridiales bacterium]
MWYIWLIATGIFFIFEIFTSGFLIFWLGIGALLAMLTSFITDDLAIQFIVFVISSAALIPLTKPLVNKYIDSKTVKTNAYSIIEKKGIVTIEINSADATGQIKVNGEIWSAKSENEKIIPVGTEVKVLNIDGVKAVVQELI